MNQWNQDFQVEFQRQLISRCATADAKYSTDSLKTCLLSRALFHNYAKNNDFDNNN